MDKNINKTLENIDRRLTRVEKELFGEEKREKPQTQKYKGLAGGIRLLLDNNFLDQPKTVDEIIAELNREGYYNTFSGVASTLSTTFVKSQKTLARIKKDEKWAYVKRK